MYNKLFTKILDSSIWLEPTPTRIVWLTFIAVMDEAGFVQFASVANVAHRARVTMEEAQAAIACLESPDENSSDPDNGGCRIERVPGGWIILNAEKHRALVTRAIIREQTNERVKRFRQKKRICNAHVTPSDTDTDNTITSNEVIGQRADPCPHQEILNLWKTIHPDCRQPKIWNGTRQANLRARWKQYPNITHWREFFESLKKSDFLMGRVNGKDRRPFDLSLDWLVKAENFNKVIEGKYHG